MPVLAASALRPLTVRVASSNPSVVRIPSAFSLDAVKAVRPSISEMGYVMMLDIKKVLKRTALSGKLTQARRPRDDLAHLIRSDFVSAEPEKFTRDVLDLAHSKAKSHQLGAERHQPSAHQLSETTAVAGGGDRGFCAGNLVNQGLNLVGGPLVAKETQNDADGFFSHNIIDAGLGGQPRNQFIHSAPPSAGCVYRVLACEFILILCETNYKRCGIRRSDSASIA